MIYLSSINIEKADILGENPLPIFKAKNREIPLSDCGLLESEKEMFGFETGSVVLPYKMQDLYTRKRKVKPIKTIVLENENLKATFLPEFGGRLYSLFDKQVQKEIIYTNPVFQPTNLALRNSWFSGGIEWNIGHYGHTFLTCDSVFFAICKDEISGEFLRMYEYERCKKTFFQADFHLPENAKQLAVHIKIENRNDFEVPVYYWTNIAIPEDESCRIFSGTDEVIYMNPITKAHKAHKNCPLEFGHNKLINLSTTEGKDASYPSNISYSCEYFFQNEKELKNTWEAACYNNNSFFFERSTTELFSRKMFCWGMQRGAMRWKEYLSTKETGAYIEVQAGITPTQVHGAKLKQNSSIAFTQVFGNGNINYKEVSGNWHEGKEALLSEIEKLISEKEIGEMNERFKASSETKVFKILHNGSGYGALEKLRDENFVPSRLCFPEYTISNEQLLWVSILKGEKLPSSTEIISFIVDEKWRSILESYVEKYNDNCTALTLLGIMLYEQFEEDKAEEAWEKANSICETPLVFRCLAIKAFDDGNITKAALYMEKAIRMLGSDITKHYAEEYIAILSSGKYYKEAWDFYSSLPSQLKSDDRILLNISECAYEVGEIDFVEKLFKHEFAVIREGAVDFIKLWFKYEAQKLAAQRGIEVTEQLLEEINQTKQPPFIMDFRMS